MVCSSRPPGIDTMTTYTRCSDSVLCAPLMVDAAVREWLRQTLREDVARGEIGEEIRRLLTAFYVDDGVLASTDPVFLQDALDKLVGLFDRVGLRTNTTKTEAVTCWPGKIRACQSKEVYAERMEVQKKKDRLENIIANSYLLDIGLENTPQVLIQFLVVLVAASPAPRFPWLAGVEAVFDTHDSASLASSLLFYFSIAWSLKSIHMGIFSTLLYRKDYSVGDYGKVLVLANILLGASARILAIVLAFVPFLGLFNHMYLHQTDTRLTYSQDLWTDEVKDIILLSRQDYRK